MSEFEYAGMCIIMSMCVCVCVCVCLCVCMCECVQACEYEMLSGDNGAQWAQ